jgi:putative tryptophan/tyrosine transport system substrate-binding protein
MRRREFITSLVSTITAWPFAGLAQTASKVYRIGVLSTDKPLPEPIFGAIVRALASHGYMPDRNVVLELRASGDHWEQLPQLAKDLVASNVDVILTRNAAVFCRMDVCYPSVRSTEGLGQ